MRVKRLVIRSEFVVAMLKGPEVHLRVAGHPLPSDAEVVHQNYDPIRAVVNVFIESASFDEVPEGDPVPEVERPLLEDIRAAT